MAMCTASPLQRHCFGARPRATTRSCARSARASSAPVRASEADARDRHRGVSHHVRDVLRLAGDGAIAALPEGLDAPEWLQPRADVDAAGWEEACAGLPLSHMRRGPGDDPLFFAAAFA